MTGAVGGGQFRLALARAPTHFALNDMWKNKQLLKLTGLLAAPALVIIGSAAAEVPGVGLGGVGLSLIAGLYCARELMCPCAWTGIRRAALHFLIGRGCCCASLGMAFLGCAALGVRS